MPGAANLMGVLEELHLTTADMVRGALKNQRIHDRSAAVRTRVIVKSGVWKIDSSGGLIDVCHFDSIVEFHSSNHLGQIIEPS